MKTTSRFAALCVALLLLVAACGSDDDESSADSGSGASNTPDGPVVIGVVGSFTGPAASTTGPMEPALDAWAKSVNDAGGLGGAEVELIVKDVGSTPGAEGLTAVRELIDQDHVVALISADANQETWLSYATDNDVPVIVAAVGLNTGPNIFQTAATPFAAAYEVVQQAKTAGPNLGFGFCAEAPSCAIGDVLTGFAEDIGGVDVPVVAQLSASQPDFTAFCQQLEDAEVDSYFLAHAEAIASRIISDCASQGVGALPILTATNGSASWLTDPAYEGALVHDLNAPFFDTTNPAMKAYRDAIDEYAPDISEVASNASTPLLAWVAGQAVVTAADKVDGPITSAALTEALYTFEDETLGGLSVPLTFDESNPSLPTCFFEWTISDGERVVANDGEPRCAPEDVLAPFIEEAR